MLVHTDEKIPIARLLSFLEHGERLAQTCAKHQAALAVDPRHRRFFLSQARQEGAHALIFQAAIAWLAPRYRGNTPMLPALEEYRTLLCDALARNDMIETLLAEQVILEGLGEAILTRIEAGLVKRAAPFGRLRRILLSQEEAHHGFGRRLLERAMADGHTDAISLQRHAQIYLELTERMVVALSDLFESIDEDPSVWAAEVKTFLPPWLSA
jgi:GNAT superfamily N-acetyltransferase